LTPIDFDPVAFLDADRLQHVGETAYPPVQVLIRNRQVAVRIVALPDDRGLVRLVVEVPVNAVVTDIQLTILVPPD
jgi:hypothetical protein